jgi:hypothetical protein
MQASVVTLVDTLQECSMDDCGSGQQVGAGQVITQHDIVFIHILRWCHLFHIQCYTVLETNQLSIAVQTHWQFMCIFHLFSYTLN